MRNGTALIPVTHVGVTDPVLPPRIQICTLCQAEIGSLPNIVEAKQLSNQVATVASQNAGESPAQAAITALDLSILTAEDRNRVRSLLTDYESVFSAHEGDLGCSN